tara:strand:- start:149 stop:523 length:375 start_codon:yes stop_codon:yes gene_type:complete
MTVQLSVYELLCKLPPHEAQDQHKLKLLINSLKVCGWDQACPPLFFAGQRLYSGSHRYGAVQQLAEELDLLDEELELEIIAYNLEEWLTTEEFEELDQAVDEQQVLDILIAADVPVEVVKDFTR